MKETIEQHMAAFDRIVAEARALKERKQKDYNSAEAPVEAWSFLGLKGIFVDLSRKYFRLLNLVWYSKQPEIKSETVRDTLLDMANYSINAIILLEREEKEKANNGV